MTMESKPFILAEYFAATASNQPILLGLPVVAPNSPAISLIFSAFSPKISVGNGPSPTLVVNALNTPITLSISLAPIPSPVKDPPEIELDEVT